jgi:DNA invertase Pin-like site-specific DNA recombinase
MMNQKTLAYYLRKSADDEAIGDSMSISGQRGILAEFVSTHPELRDWNIVEFSDDGYSGTTFERPGVKKMLESVRCGEINGIIVKDLSRFGRNYIEVGDYLEQIFPFLGVRFISVNDGFDSAKMGCSAGDVSIAFKNLLHDYYAKDISNKLRAVWKLKKERGEYISPVAFFGYTKDKANKHKLVVDEPAAAIVRRVFSLILAGNTTGQTARLLNEEGLLTPGAYKLRNGQHCNGNKLNRNNSWTGTTVYNMIGDLRYTGCMVNGKRAYDTISSKKFRLLPQEQWIICENTHEAIISKEDFEKAQLCVRKNNKRTQQKETNLLSGKVRCGICGYMMQPSADKQQKYRCRRAKYAEAGACFTGGIPKKQIEDAVFASIQVLTEVLIEKDSQIRVAKAMKSEVVPLNHMEQLHFLKKRMDSIKKNKMLFYDQYCDEHISKAEYMEQRNNCDILLRELEEQAVVIEKELFVKEALPDSPALSLLRSIDLTAGLTRELVKELVDKILIYDDTRIKIIWQFTGYPFEDITQQEKGVLHETA